MGLLGFSAIPTGEPLHSYSRPSCFGQSKAQVVYCINSDHETSAREPYRQGGLNTLHLYTKRDVSARFGLRCRRREERCEHTWW